MQVSLEETGTLDRTMTVQIPRDRLDGEVQKRLQSLTRRVKIDGFRPGKVPLKVVRARYGTGVYQEVLGDLVQESYVEAVREQNLAPAGGPEIEAKPMQEDGPIEFVARFQVLPEVVVADLSDVEIEKPKVEIDAADVDRVIESLRKQNREFREVERAATKGDRVTLDFAGELDGEAFPGGSAKDMQVEVGSGRMLADFETGLEGVEAGQEKVIEVAFPDDYPAENLKGRNASFTLTIHRVEAPELPDVDEAFVRKFGIEDGSVDKLRDEVRSNMQRELAQTIKGRVKNQVMDTLVARHEFEIPKALVKGEIDRMREEAEKRFGGAKNSQPLPDQMFESQAERRVRLGLVVRKIIETQSMEADAARVDAELETIASTYEDPAEVRRYYQSQPQAMANLQSMVLEDQVVDWVVSQGRLTETEQRFEEVMNQKSADAGEQSDDADKG